MAFLRCCLRIYLLLCLILSPFIKGQADIIGIALHCKELCFETNGKRNQNDM